MLFDPLVLLIVLSLYLTHESSQGRPVTARTPVFFKTSSSVSPSSLASPLASLGPLLIKAPLSRSRADWMICVRPFLCDQPACDRQCRPHQIT